MLHQARSGFAVLEAVISGPNNWRSGFGAILLDAQWLRSGFEAGFQVALERQHCQFEPVVAATWLQSSHFECTVASKWLQSNHFEHFVASKCQAAPVRGFEMASEHPFQAHSGCEVASEQLFRTHSGLEVAQMASVREIAMFLRRQMGTKPRDPQDLRDLPTPKRNY